MLCDTTLHAWSRDYYIVANLWYGIVEVPHRDVNAALRSLDLRLRTKSIVLVVCHHSNTVKRKCCHSNSNVIALCTIYEIEPLAYMFGEHTTVEVDTSYYC